MTSTTTRIDWSGADAASTAELDATLKALLAEWPHIVPGAVTVDRPIGTGDDGEPMPQDQEDGVMGETDGRDNHIRINPSFASDYQRWCKELKKACKRGSLHKGIESHPAQYTLVHEFGHVFANTVFGRLDPDDNSGDPPIRQLVIDVWASLAPSREVADDIHRSINLDEVPLAWSFGYGRGELMKDLTEYASASPHELIAESFAVHRTLGPGVSKTADLVMARLTAAYEAKFGRVAA